MIPPALPVQLLGLMLSAPPSTSLSLPSRLPSSVAPSSLTVTASFPATGAKLMTPVNELIWTCWSFVAPPVAAVQPKCTVSPKPKRPASTRPDALPMDTPLTEYDSVCVDAVHVTFTGYQEPVSMLPRSYGDTRKSEVLPNPHMAVWSLTMSGAPL